MNSMMSYLSNYVGYINNECFLLQGINLAGTMMKVKLYCWFVMSPIVVLIVNIGVGLSVGYGNAEVLPSGRNPFRWLLWWVQREASTAQYIHRLIGNQGIGNILVTYLIVTKINAHPRCHACFELKDELVMQMNSQVATTATLKSGTEYESYAFFQQALQFSTSLSWLPLQIISHLAISLEGSVMVMFTR